MTKKKLTVGVGSIEDAARDFIDVWHQVESGKLPKNAPIEKITFSDQRLLFKTLSPRRCDLLRYVHEHGKISIRALAKGIDRDYSNVHQDVKTLLQVGLILKDEKSDKYHVPWDVIVTEIPMFSPPAANEQANPKRCCGASVQVSHR